MVIDLPNIAGGEVLSCHIKPRRYPSSGWFPSGAADRLVSGKAFLIFANPSQSCFNLKGLILTSILACFCGLRPCAEQAAVGCTAILQTCKGVGESNGPLLKTDDALLILRTAATALAPHLQALAQPQRAACLHLMYVAIQASWQSGRMFSFRVANLEN